MKLGPLAEETPSGQHLKYDSLQFSLNISHPSKSVPFAEVLLSGQQPNFVAPQSILGAGVVDFSHPFLFGPLEKVLLSSQQPYLDLRHGDAGGGHPSLSLPSAGVLLSGQHPKSVSLQWVCGQPAIFSSRAGDTPSSQQPYLLSLQVFGIGQPVFLYQ